MFDDEKPTYPVSREKLYEMAWSEPMTAIGRYFEVSSSYLARIYTHLNVPRPAPGYWAKIAHGKPASKPALPVALPGQELGWDRNNEQILFQPPKPTPPRVPARRAPPLKERTDRPEIHPLLRGAKEHFLKSGDSNIGYLRPYKRRLVDLFVSNAGLDKGLEIANTLFLAFEDHGYRVSFPPNLHMYKRDPVDEREKSLPNGYRYGCDWSPDRGTIAHVGEVAIGLSLFEISESIEVKNVNGEYVPVATLKQKYNRLGDIGWTIHKDYPTGRFCLQAYSPYMETTWLQQWALPANADCAAVEKNSQGASWPCGDHCRSGCTGTRGPTKAPSGMGRAVPEMADRRGRPEAERSDGGQSTCFDEGRRSLARTAKNRGVLHRSRSGRKSPASGSAGTSRSNWSGASANWRSRSSSEDPRMEITTRDSRGKKVMITTGGERSDVLF